MGRDQSGLSELLEAEYERLSVRRRELEDTLRRTQEEIEAIVRRLGHVQALLGQTGHELARAGHPDRREALSMQPGDEIDDPVELAHSILQELGGEPVHYRQLAEEVLESGGELGGKDPAQTLVSRLVRDDRFVRPLRRGWYALRVHYPKAKSVGARTRRRRARGRRK